MLLVEALLDNTSNTPPELYSYCPIPLNTRCSLPVLCPPMPSSGVFTPRLAVTSDHLKGTSGIQVCLLLQQQHVHLLTISILKHLCSLVPSVILSFSYPITLRQTVVLEIFLCVFFFILMLKQVCSILKHSTGGCMICSLEFCHSRNLLFGIKLILSSVSAFQDSHAFIAV